MAGSCEAVAVSARVPSPREASLDGWRPTRTQVIGHASEEIPLPKADRINPNHRLVLTVTSVKVRRIMITVQYADNDAEELRDPWHVVMIAEVEVVGGAVSDSA